jgi:hypothetical protein
MLDEKSKTSRFIGLFLLGNFLYCYPVLTLFNVPATVFGIPVFFLFFFSAWIGLICLMLVCAETSPKINMEDPLQPDKQNRYIKHD